MFSVAFIRLFLGLPVLLAYVEEGLWDGFIWTAIGLFQILQPISDEDVLVWLVPLLALPQITHYLVDAVIWRMTLPGAPWKRIMFPVAVH